MAEYEQGAREEQPAVVRAARRQEIAEALYAERNGRGACSVVTRIRIEEFADLSAELETMSPTSKPALDVSARRERIGALLQGDIPGVLDPRDIPRRTADQLVTRCEELLEQARSLRDAEQETLLFSDTRVGAPSTENASARDAGPPAEAQPDAVPAPTLAPAPAPTPKCAFCYQPLARCAELKKTNYAAWETFHDRDPEVVKKKNEEATAVMLKMLPFGNPY